MNRRHALMGLSAIAGHALFPEALEAFAKAIAGGQDGWTAQVVNEPQSRILTEAVETILPQTDTPGAKAARVHVFVDLALAKCVPPADQQKVLRALDALGPGFVTGSAADREKALTSMDKDAFALLKQLTVLGYCTSQPGATQALAYDKVPGGYRGCLDLTPGQKSWATR
jgi:hypothetical protein